MRDKDVPRVCKDFCGLLARIYPVGKVLPGLGLEHITDLPKLKGLLSEPLMSLSRNCTRDDVGLAGSLFLFRKVMPTPAGDDPVPGYISKMGRHQTLNEPFLRFAARELPHLFPRGWDSGYVGFCSRSIPSVGACTERNRKRGGVREELRSKMSSDAFVTACLTGKAVVLPDERHIKVLDQDGKLRIVTISSATQAVLGPLHHLLYSCISRRKWLLKGEATANSFAEFGRVEGEVFVSGDYEAATDNFNRLHSEFILELILRSSYIPEPIQKLALSSLSGTLKYKGVSYPQVAGQLMGNLLSFPLLCITNYLAFKYAIRRTVPLRINGDDIVFRATPGEANHWMQIVSDAGLTLSRGKTLVHPRFFSVNSCFLQARTGRKPSLVPVVRAKSIYANLQPGAGRQLAARLASSCKGMIGYRKGMVRGHILRYHRKAVSQLGCSLNRALGIRVTYDALAYGEALDQEVYYLRVPAQYDKPRRAYLEGTRARVPVTKGWSQVPGGVISKAMRAKYSAEWGDHCYEYAWQHGGVDGGRLIVEPPMYGYRSLGCLGAHARRLKVSIRGLGRLLRYHWRRDPRVKTWLYDRQRSKVSPDYVWVPEGGAELLRPVLKFVRTVRKVQPQGAAADDPLADQSSTQDS